MSELLCELCGGPLTPSGELGRSCPQCLLSLAMPDEEPEASPVSLAPGTMVGRYRILRLIGEGGMGAVYEAEQEHPRRRVALKIIKPGLASLELLRRFEHESIALGRLQHPGIAQVYEAGTADTGYGPQPYFAMEFIHGETLRDYAEKHRLSTRGRLELMARVCDAVHHAHQRGLIHRDLKPGNILVDHDGRPKILDFGVARLTNCDTKSTLHTVTGRLVGTLAYMSPEQALADPLELDIRSDVYSLGVILYELLAARLPYTIGKQIYEALEAIRSEDPSRLSSIDRRYRGDIETIVAKALEKDKTRRYSSAAELAADIQRHLRDEPIVARPPSAAYQLKKFARRHKAFVGGIAAVFVVLVAAVAVISWLALGLARQQEITGWERDSAVRAQKELAIERNNAARERDGAVLARQEAEDKQLQLTRANTQTLRDGNRITWMSLLREASRLFARRTDEELAALLARQAFLVHRFTPDEPRYPIEEVLQQAARSSRWSRTLIGHERFVTSVAFSSLDGAIASGSADFTVRVWNPRDPDPTPVTFKGHTNTVNTVAFSPTDWRIASGGQDGTVRLWNRRELDAPPVVVKNDLRDPVSSVSFSPDGARLAIGTNEGAWIADLRKPGSPPLRLGGLYPPPGPDLPFASIAFSPDGEHVAGGTTRGDLRVYDLRAESYRLFRGHTGAVTAVAFSPDGKRLASAGLSPDWNIRLWDPADNTIPPVVVPGQESQANALAFSKDGKLVSAGKDGGLRFWSLSQSGMKPQYVQAHDGSANSVAFSPDGERVATAGLSHVVISNLRDDGMPLRFPRVHRDRVNALAFSPDNAYLVSGSEDRTARVWNLRNPSATPASLPHPEAVLPIVFSFSADGARLATATFGSVRLWNLRDPGSQPSLFWNESIPTLASLPDAAALASMTNGSGVALASRNQRGPVLSLVLSEPPAVKQWDLLSAVSQQVRSHLAAFSDDLKLIASPQTDNAIRVQDLSRPNVPPVRLAGHKGEVTALAFSHNGALLASVGRDRAVRVWDLKKPDTPLYVFQGSGNFVGFSPDDTRLLAGGMDAPDVRLWDLRASSSPPLVFNGGKAAILSAALSRDGTYLALGDADGDVWLHRLWSGAADYLCTRISRNLSLQEWRSYVGESIPYERTCPGLPPGAGATAVKP